MYRKNHTPHEEPLIVKDESGKNIKNPNEITVNQHVIPQKHLREWVNCKKLLTVIDKDTNKSFTPAPKDAFVVSRLWNQQMEQGTIKNTEDKYQEQIQIFRSTGELARHIIITEYFVMLAVRAYVAAKERPDYPSIMESFSYVSSQEELELEEVGQVDSNVWLISGGGTGQEIARSTVSICMTSMFIQGRERWKNAVWLPYESQEVLFVLPDSLWDLYANQMLVFPVSPNLVLIEESLHKKLFESGELTPEKLNALFVYRARQHFVQLSN
jgi:hypothetical protein